MITDYHAKLFAHEPNRRHSVAGAEKIASTLFDAQVDLNPHQVEAALFSFKSFHFAARKADELMVTPWDLVVIDEAHRLRNVYRRDNRIGRALKTALANAPKVLLTATPLQNSLMELYGLVSIIDDYTFGDAKSFREKFTRLAGDGLFNELKARQEVSDELLFAVRIEVR